MKEAGSSIEDRREPLVDAFSCSGCDALMNRLLRKASERRRIDVIAGRLSAAAVLTTLVLLPR